MLVMQAVKINGNLLHLLPHIAKQKTRMAYSFFFNKVKVGKSAHSAQ